MGFRTLASARVPREIQQAFIQSVVARHWYSHKPPMSGYRAVYLHQVTLEHSLFGWLYNDGADDPSRSHVPYFICYYLAEPLYAFQLENIFTYLYKGPVALIDRHNLSASLETMVVPDLSSYQPARPGVAIPSVVRKHSHIALQQGELLDLFVNRDEQEMVIELNPQTYEQYRASPSIYMHHVVRYIVEGIETGAAALNENAAAIETGVIKPYQKAKFLSTIQKRETILLLIYTVLAGCLAVGSLWLVGKLRSGRTVEPSVSQSGAKSNSSVATTYSLQERISLGDKILVMADTTADKQAGVQAFASGDFATAITKLQLSLQLNRNDPEALIYLNNAKAAQLQALKIAVSVPIGGNLDAAKEILRGVAQAQNEVNQSGGINGSLLQVEIANDDNDPAIAQYLAAEFVKDSSIFAVVGHNSSDASLAAAPVYQQGQLVMISPTSYASKLSGIGSYIFRTVPSTRSMAETFSSYALSMANIKNLAICADSKAIVTQSLKEEFTSIFSAHGGKVVGTDCDFSAANFNPRAVISHAISDGAYGLLLSPTVDNINPALDVIRANKAKLTLLGSQSLYTFKTLQVGQAGSNGMVLIVSWHPTAIPGNPFPDRAAKLWGGPVNWRTAMAYDATKVIITGLRQSNTRDELQKLLSSPGFSVKGATGKIEFLPSGDRNGEANLIIIEPGSASGTGYDFVPLSLP